MNLSRSFALLTYSGLWKPVSWTSPRLSALHNFIIGLLVLLTFLMLTTQFLDILLNVEDVETLTENCFIFLSIFALCGKIIEILRHRRDILELVKMLVMEPCKPQTKAEIAIQEQYDVAVRRNTYVFGFALMVTAFLMLSKALFIDSKNRALLFRAWVPFNLTASSEKYWLMMTHQYIVSVSASLFTIAVETLLCGFMINTCAQMDIFKERLKNLVDKPNEKLLTLMMCVKHHERIYLFSKKLNRTFSMVIFVQFCVSSLILCLSLYQIISSIGFNMKFLTMISYMNTGIVQIFIYCWFGNEVHLKSIEVGDAIFALQWTSLDTPTQKDLILIMRRTTRPISFKSGSIVTLNLDSFTVLMKLSYSAFNLLNK